MHKPQCERHKQTESMTWNANIRCVRADVDEQSESWYDWKMSARRWASAIGDVADAIPQERMQKGACRFQREDNVWMSSVMWHRWRLSEVRMVGSVVIYNVRMWMWMWMWVWVWTIVGVGHCTRERANTCEDWWHGTRAKQVRWTSGVNDREGTKIRPQ